MATQEDTQKLDFFSAQLGRALAIPHSWSPALDYHEVLGVGKEGPPTEKPQTKPPKGDKRAQQTAAFARTLDWLDDEQRHHFFKVGLAAWKQQEYARWPEEATKPMELFVWWGDQVREPYE